MYTDSSEFVISKPFLIYILILMCGIIRPFNAHKNLFLIGWAHSYQSVLLMQETPKLNQYTFASIKTTCKFSSFCNGIFNNVLELNLCSRGLIFFAPFFDIFYPLLLLHCQSDKQSGTAECKSVKSAGQQVSSVGGKRCA